MDDGFFDTLRKGEKHEGVPLDETSLQRLCVLNPIANAIGFRTMIDTAFEVLVGLEPNRKRRNSRPVYEFDESSGTYCGRRKGVVGAPLAYEFVVENNGKHAMHVHGMVWGAITEDLLSKAAGRGVKCLQSTG